MQKLNDDSLMPWGEYKGKLMKEVPNKYLFDIIRRWPNYNGEVYDYARKKRKLLQGYREDELKENEGT